MSHEHETKRGGIEPRGISLNEARQYLGGISRSSLYRLFESGTLPRPRKVGGGPLRLDFTAVKRLADKTWGQP